MLNAAAHVQRQHVHCNCACMTFRSGTMPLHSLDKRVMCRKTGCSSSCTTRGGSVNTLSASTAVHVMGTRGA